MEPNNRYIFKYNQDGILYNYVELTKYDKLLSYMKIEDEKKLIRFDRQTDTKQMSEYKHPVKLRQRYSAGESFMSVFNKSTDDSVQYDFPEMTKHVVLINNNVSMGGFGQYVVDRNKDIQNKS